MIRIGGLQKLTLLDYPSKVAATVFLSGCNFRCPFCHNADLVLAPNASSSIDEEDLDRFLNKRRGVLDGICVTGGEPLAQAETPDLLKKIKSYGFLVKLDTNGSFPDALSRVIEENLADYIAMDVKNAPARYAETIGIPRFDLTPIFRSVELLKRGGVPYEFRTTAVAEYHDEQSVRETARWLTGSRAYFLQNFQDSGNLIASGLHAVPKKDMEAFLQIARQFVPDAQLRGI